MKKLLRLYLFLILLLLSAGLSMWWLIPWQAKKPDITVHSLAGNQLESQKIESHSPSLARAASLGVKATTIPEKATKPQNIIQQTQPVQTEADQQIKGIKGPVCMHCGTPLINGYCSKCNTYSIPMWYNRPSFMWAKKNM